MTKATALDLLNSMKEKYYEFQNSGLLEQVQYFSIDEAKDRVYITTDVTTRESTLTQFMQHYKLYVRKNPDTWTAPVQLPAEQPKESALFDPHRKRHIVVDGKPTTSVFEARAREKEKLSKLEERAESLLACSREHHQAVADQEPVKPKRKYSKRAQVVQDVPAELSGAAQKPKRKYTKRNKGAENWFNDARQRLDDEQRTEQGLADHIPDAPLYKPNLAKGILLAAAEVEQKEKVALPGQRLNLQISQQDLNDCIDSLSYAVHNANKLLERLKAAAAMPYPAP